MANTMPYTFNLELAGINYACIRNWDTKKQAD